MKGMDRLFCKLLMPQETFVKVESTLASLKAGACEVGGRLLEALADRSLESMDAHGFISALLDTKRPMIFAESAVAGDGSDWTQNELSILGDVSVSAPVVFFDNAHHTRPDAHSPAFEGTLIFTPGALLGNGQGCTPADWNEVVRDGSEFNRERYYGLYRRRLLPVFQAVNEMAASIGRFALLTVPGIGCGQFAGPFRGRLGAELAATIERFLDEFGLQFPWIRVVRYDPYDECSDAECNIHGVSLRVRPLLRGNHPRPQLCRPLDYQEGGDNFQDFALFSVVAWDHVSWPGNDFFGGYRSTDDGVKAAASSSMAVVTGVNGWYDTHFMMYRPPTPYRSWNDVVQQNALRLTSRVKFRGRLLGEAESWARDRR